MAHFANLESQTDPTGFTSDEHLVVVRVVVVGNDIPANGDTIEDNDMHTDGEIYCKNLFNGGMWKQTSFSNSFRKQFAGRGMVYDPTKDKFISEQPYATWTLNDIDNWVAPITYPNDVTDKNIVWDDTNQKWIATDNSDPVNNFDWNSSELTWVSV